MGLYLHLSIYFCVGGLQRGNCTLPYITLWHMVGWGTLLQTRRSQVQFPRVSLAFFIDIILPHYGPGVDSASSRSEYHEYFLGVKAAGAWGWQPCYLHVPIFLKSESLNLLEPSGPVKACNVIALPFILPYITLHVFSSLLQESDVWSNVCRNQHTKYITIGLKVMERKWLPRWVYQVVWRELSKYT
jgi:hypothetical protein